MKPRERTKNQERITRDPDVMMGKPCITGTRITVEYIVREIEAGLSIEDFLDDYPQLTRADIKAALHYKP